MKILLLHSDFLEFEPKKKAIESAEKVDLEKERFDECLVVFSSVEKGDAANMDKIVKKTVAEIEDVAKKVDAKKIVIYPWVHLTDNPEDGSKSLKVLEAIRSEIENENYEVHRAPFGWYKSFEIKVKGHPLSELSRHIKLGDEEENKEENEAIKAEKKLKSYWYIMTPEGELIDVDKFDFKEYPNLKKFADYEITKNRISSSVPPHVKYMRKLELVDYEPASDKGTFRWYPKGILIKRLLEQHVTDMVVKNGAMEVETPIMYDYNHPALLKYLNKFPARQYTLNSDKRKFFLRFAACFGQYMIKRDMTISYKDLPLKLYELTHFSFRHEQSGELSGLRRLRVFTMPDMHTLAKDMKQATDEYLEQYKIAMKWMKDLDLDYEVGIRFVRDFFEDNKDFVKKLVNLVGKPVLIEMWDERPFYYVMKFEFNVVDNQDKAAALSTIQIDVENTKRFDITYKDKDNQDKYPLLLHASISGSIDRNLYALLEKAYKDKLSGKQPELPLWLSPTQVRFITVKGEYVHMAEEFGSKMERIRWDIDDRDESVSKKIRDAEMEWIPYIVVIGEKEKEGELTIRVRNKGEIKMSLEDLIKEIHKKTNEYPFRVLSLPRKLSVRPIFVG